MRERFLIVNFDRLCLHTQIQIKRIINFLKISENINVEKLINLIKIPKSIGRYKKYNLSMFSKEQIKAVEDFGFKIF